MSEDNKKIELTHMTCFLCICYNCQKAIHHVQYDSRIGKELECWCCGNAEASECFDVPCHPKYDRIN